MSKFITLPWIRIPDPNWAKILDPDPNSMNSIWIQNTYCKDIVANNKSLN